MYFHANGKLSFTAPAANESGFDEYISDPAKPVPFRARPIPTHGYDEAKGQTWPRWLVDDQREASGRTDVLSYTSDVLTAPVKISGEPVAHLLASTSGSDSDWVVKLIDVYPSDYPASGEEQARGPDVAKPTLTMAGYQQLVRGDPLRGRFRPGLIERHLRLLVADPRVVGGRFGLRLALLHGAVGRDCGPGHHHDRNGNSH